MKKRSKALLLLYILFLLWVVLFKGEINLSWLDDWSLESLKKGAGEGHYNLFFTIDNFLHAYLQGNLDPWYFWSNILGNVLVFVPLGFLLRNQNYSWKKCLFFGLGLILVIESLQLVTRLGVFDVDDILLNGLGVLLGIMAHDLLVWKRGN